MPNERDYGIILRIEWGADQYVNKDICSTMCSACRINEPVYKKNN